MRRKNTQINSSQDDCWHGYFSLTKGHLRRPLLISRQSLTAAFVAKPSDGRPILSINSICPISSSPPVRCVWREQVRYPQTIYPLCFYRKDRFGQNRADVYRKRIRQLCARMRPERKPPRLSMWRLIVGKLIGSQKIGLYPILTVLPVAEVFTPSILVCLR